MADRNGGWLETFGRECGIRRCLIVHGNVGDLCYSVDAQDYRPTLEVMTQSLTKRGFKGIVVWDRVSGIQNVSDDLRETLQRQAVENSRDASPAGEEYDAGHGTSTRVSPPGAQGRTPPNPDDFFATVYHHLVHEGENRYAFIIDGSSYLFGNPNALSEQERQWLLTLSKAIRNAPERLDPKSLQRPSNIVILLTTRLAGIPPLLYQNDPRVKDISVPLPGRTERCEFLKRRSSHFLLEKPIAAGSTAFEDFADLLDGFTVQDMQQLAKLSRQAGGPLSAEKLVNLYRYGEKTSPWEELSREKLLKIEDSLREWVKGQDEPIKKVREVLVRAYTGLSGLLHSRKQRAPKGVLFFVGPTGVGKTELAKALARFLFGDEEACLRFDMSEYNHGHSDQRLVGAPPGYVGYEEGGQLTNAVRRRPFSVILFDEIEKADKKILDKFLQILEDGRLTDGKGETVTFAETVIIFTSNIGAADVGYSDNPGQVREQFKQKVREYFLKELKRPELLNRIGDNLVPFNFVSGEDALVSIARAKLAPLREGLREKYGIQDLSFDNEEKALKAIISGVDRANGGRGVKNEIDARVLNPLSEFLLESEVDRQFYAGRRIRVIQAGGGPAFGFKLE